MSQSLERTLNIYLNALPEKDKDYVEISNLVQEPNMANVQEYISLLALQWKIDAHKKGRNCFTTR